MAKEKLLFDPSSSGGLAKRVLVSEKADDFKAAASQVGQRILYLLASGPKYPAEIARALGAHHQTVYYNTRKLESAGLITRVKSQKVRGGEANVFALSADGYAVEFQVTGEELPTLQSSARSKALGNFFQEFLREGRLDGWIVVGSPVPHGEAGTQARDGHYAVQLGFALGQFVNVPSPFPVKLDVDVKAEKLQSSNMIVVGGPRNNIIAEEINRYLPIRFKQGGSWGSIVDGQGRSYNSELDCVVAKIRNPWNSQQSCVLVAGLSGGGTKAGIIGICNYSETLFRNYRSGDFACVVRGADRDGDGKVDSVDVLKRE